MFLHLPSSVQEQTVNSSELFEPTGAENLIHDDRFLAGYSLCHSSYDPFLFACSVSSTFTYFTYNSHTIADEIMKGFAFRFNAL